MTQALEHILLFGIFPAWLAAGLADWLCHRRTDIAHTSGPAESRLHLLMLAQTGAALVAGLLLQINALLLALFAALWLAHQLTSLADTAYAAPRRPISPLEQHVHSFLDLLPLMALMVVALLHLEQSRALLGIGDATADWSLAWKPRPLPTTIVVAVLGACALLGLLPYLQEWQRGRRAG